MFGESVELFRDPQIEEQPTLSEVDYQMRFLFAYLLIVHSLTTDPFFVFQF